MCVDFFSHKSSILCTPKLFCDVNRFSLHFPFGGSKSYSCPLVSRKGPAKAARPNTGRLVTQAVWLHRPFGYGGRLVTQARCLMVTQQSEQQTFVWGLVATGVICFFSLFLGLDVRFQTSDSSPGGDFCA